MLQTDVVEIPTQLSLASKICINDVELFGVNLHISLQRQVLLDATALISVK